MLNGNADPATVSVLHWFLLGTLVRKSMVFWMIPGGIKSPTSPRSTIRSTLLGRILLVDRK
jgi:hypothetical protein